MFSLSQSAKLTGVSKATIHRAIKSGKLSAARQEDGSYQIDPAELHRVYEIVETAQKRPETGSRGTAPRSGQNAETAASGLPDGSGGPSREVLVAELAGARQLIRHLEAQVEDLRGDRDGWRQQAEGAQRLIPHAGSSPESSGPSERLSWWKRRRG